jgi:hypothetical protein
MYELPIILVQLDCAGASENFALAPTVRVAAAATTQPLVMVVAVLAKLFDPMTPGA